MGFNIKKCKMCPQHLGSAPSVKGVCFCCLKCVHCNQKIHDETKPIHFSRTSVVYTPEGALHRKCKENYLERQASDRMA